MHADSRLQPKCIEWFCGIGAFAAAFSSELDIVAAVDINTRALEIYQANFNHPAYCKTIESLTPEEVLGWQADFWWMSPPCQPFTLRGKRQDELDSRSAALENLIRLIPACQPRWIGVENVPSFRNSLMRNRLVEQLKDCGYRIWETEFCPTTIGIPNRRLRYFGIFEHPNTHVCFPPVAAIESTTEPVGAFLEAELPDDLNLDQESYEKYLSALSIVDPQSHSSSCFTSAYGRSIVRSGSYVRTVDSIRRFSPKEVLNLLGFDDHFRLPSDASRKLWPLTGNSVSVFALKKVVADWIKSSRTEPL